MLNWTININEAKITHIYLYYKYHTYFMHAFMFTFNVCIKYLLYFSYVQQNDNPLGIWNKLNPGTYSLIIEQSNSLNKWT